MGDSIRKRHSTERALKLLVFLHFIKQYSAAVVAPGLKGHTEIFLD